MSQLDFMNKESIMNCINEAAAYIQSKSDFNPKIALVLGSGLGNFAKQIENPVILDFEEIPHFPKPTVEGHGGKIFLGKLQGKDVIILQGRYHYYEGYDTQTITFPIRVLAKMKIESLVLTNACGGVNKHFKPGDLMIIDNHLSMWCPNPLRGVHLDEFGPRFSDMSQPYDLGYIELAHQAAKANGLKVQQGVYGYWHGPTYETAAEIHAYERLGADTVGMSTVPENIIAVNAGMKVLGISCITNMTCIHSKGVTSHEEVMEMGRAVEKDFTNLLNTFIGSLV